jgi:hypothetical protein
MSVDRVVLVCVRHMVYGMTIVTSMAIVTSMRAGVVHAGVLTLLRPHGEMEPLSNPAFLNTSKSCR